MPLSPELTVGIVATVATILASIIVAVINRRLPTTETEVELEKLELERVQRLWARINQLEETHQKCIERFNDLMEECLSLKIKLAEVNVELVGVNVELKAVRTRLVSLEGPNL